MNDNERHHSSKDKKTPLFMYGLIAALIIIILFFAFKDKKGTYQESSTQTIQQTPRSSIPAKGKISAIKKYLAQHPDAAQWWAELAEVYAADGQFFEAIAAYERHLKIKPDAVDTWVTVGLMYKKIKQPNKALTAFDKAIALQPDHEIALFNKGALLLYDFKDRAQAVKAWETLLSFHPDAKAPNGVPVKAMVAQVRRGMSFVPSSAN